MPKRLSPLPMIEGRSLRDHVRLNRDFIRQCHHDKMQVIEIAAALGLKKSKSNLYALFKDCKVGRSYMGFDPIFEVRRRERAAALDPFKSRIHPQDGRCILDHILKNKVVIIKMHRAGFYQDEIAGVLNVRASSLNTYLIRANVTRKALSLPKLPLRRNKQLYKPLTERLWTAREDAHIRRAHGCGFSVAAAAALCRRSGRDIQSRAQALGLGVWTAEPDPRRRQAAARDYDRRNESRLLFAETVKDTAPKGLPEDRPGLK